MVELCQTPVNQAQLRWEELVVMDEMFGGNPWNLTNLALLVVNHDVVRLDISVHDALAVAEVQCLEQLEDIEADIEVVELGV